MLQWRFLCERSWGGLFVEREKESRGQSGWGWLGRSWAREKESRDREKEQRLRASRFWKMVYGKKFRKPSS